MRISDFEKAIAATGAELLRVVYSALTGRKVQACYGQQGLSYIKWDDTGRAFTYTQKADQEDCVSEYNLASLPYERDPRFDLKFE